MLRKAFIKELSKAGKRAPHAECRLCMLESMHVEYPHTHTYASNGILSNTENSLKSKIKKTPNNCLVQMHQTDAEKTRSFLWLRRIDIGIHATSMGNTLNIPPKIFRELKELGKNFK